MIKSRSLGRDYFVCFSQNNTQLTGYYFKFNSVLSSDEVKFNKTIDENKIELFAVSFDIKSKQRMIQLILSDFRPQHA
jgi:hypothetical protein